MTKINELFLSHKPRKIVANREQIPLSGKVARVRFGVVAAARIDESGAAIYYRLFTKDELLGLLPYQMEYFAVSHASLEGGGCHRFPTTLGPRSVESRWLWL